MLAQRSKRERKKINYACLGHDDDDDFANPTPPSKKKSSLSSNKENKSKKPDKSVKVDKKKTERQSLEEKLFARQLQEALNQSLSESQGSSDSEAVTLVDTPPPCRQVAVTVENTPVEADNTAPNCDAIPVQGEVTKPKPCEDNQPTETKVNVTKRPAENISDEIQILEEDVTADEQPAKRRRVTATAIKKSKYIDSDSEGSEFEADSDSDDDFDDGEDSDFDAEIESKNKGKTKNPPAAKKQDPKAKTSKTKPTPAVKEPKPAPKSRTPVSSAKTTVAVKKSYTSPVSASIPARGGVASGLTGCKPTWTPPALSSSCKSSAGGTTITSPTSGIRLGLSRNQRVKPLHPSLKVQH